MMKTMTMTTIRASSVIDDDPSGWNRCQEDSGALLYAQENVRCCRQSVLCGSTALTWIRVVEVSVWMMLRLLLLLVPICRIGRWRIIIGTRIVGTIATHVRVMCGCSVDSVCSFTPQNEYSISDCVQRNRRNPLSTRDFADAAALCHDRF